MPYAIQFTHNTCTKSALYRRVKRHKRKHKGEKNTKTAKSFPVPKRMKFTCRGSVISSITTTSSDECESGQMDFRIAATVDSGLVIQKVTATKLYKCSATISMAARDFLSWCDAKKIIPYLTMRKRRSSKEVCRSNFHRNANNLLAYKRYSEAFKNATSQASALQEQNKKANKQQAKSMAGYRTICKSINETDIDRELDKKLKPTTIREVVAAGRIGVSPLKKGRPRIAPV